MKQPHNMEKGNKKHFKNLLELDVFAETYDHDSKEFKVESNDGFTIEKL
ncbi:hypothetical protein PL373_18940 [Tenacibaculum maritimum]|nr:hypothetical protein [Tenacibaculum maritimum]MDB0603165.1 hypothetical protein [Tenacibaculum maritimum]MDB0610428.1 hypothetical protein [Tenacibaculum maritimum]